MLGKLSALQIAMLVSVAVHGVLLSVRFVDPERFNRIFEDTPLEVILVNSRSSQAPDLAQAIAQATLAGGGESDRGRATSPLLPSPQAELGDAEDESRKQIEQLQQTQQQLLTQVRREHRVDEWRLAVRHRVAGDDVMVDFGHRAAPSGTVSRPSSRVKRKRDVTTSWSALALIFAVNAPNGAAAWTIAIA